MSDFSATASNASSFVPEAGPKHESHKSQPEEQGRNINLKDALEWLLGTTGSDEEHALTEDERAARKERRVELLVWLMNLEPRLSPYSSEPA